MGLPEDHPDVAAVYLEVYKSFIEAVGGARVTSRVAHGRRRRQPCFSRSLAALQHTGSPLQRPVAVLCAPHPPPAVNPIPRWTATTTA